VLASDPLTVARGPPSAMFCALDQTL